MGSNAPRRSPPAQPGDVAVKAGNVLATIRGICNLATIPGNTEEKKIRMAIRVLLRSRDDGLFVSGTAAWSPHPSRAKVFANARTAKEFATEQELKAMEIIVIRDKGPELRIPLNQPRPSKNAREPSAARLACA